MNQAEDLSSKAPEEIRQQIEITQAALSEKLETLETEVKVTVADAKSEVRETVADVKRAFDVKQHMHNHPWYFVGSAVAAGVLIGSLQTRSDHRKPPNNRNGEAAEPKRESGSRVQGFFGQQFSAEFSQLKGIAIGAIIASAGKMIKESLPDSISRKVGEVIDDVSSKLGSKRN